MSTYTGSRKADGTVVVKVDGRTFSPKASLKVMRHSPDGFEWGYGGSGPAQLALAILLHHFHRVQGKPYSAAKIQAVRLHQDFKFKVVAQLDRDSWKLYTSDVELALEWIYAEHPEKYLLAA